MPWIGSSFSRDNGTHTGSTVWAQDAAAGTNIVANNHDAHDQDLASGINACLNKSGANTPTADLPMGGFKHTNVDDGAARAEYATVGQLQDTGVSYGGASTGAANVYAVTLTPAITALADGMELSFVAHQANSGAATLNVCSLGAVAIRDANNAALVSGAIISGAPVTVSYSASANTWKIVSDVSGSRVVTGTLSVTGEAALSVGASLGNSAVASTTRLDWYEEGTFTPSIVGLTTAGAGTYTNRTGRYTRIGDVVYFQIWLTWTAHTGTGLLSVSGLPFTSSAIYSAVSAFYDTLLLSAGKQLVMMVYPSSTTINPYICDPEGGAYAAPAIDTSANLIISGSYFV